MLFGTKQRTSGMTGATVSRAQDRASKISTPDLVQWAETVSMNMQANLSAYMQTGNADLLLEVQIQAESLHGMVSALLARDASSPSVNGRHV